MSTISTYIRDQAYQRLTTGTVGSNWKTTRKVPIPTLQGDQLPSLSVYVLREMMIPDGDGNTGGLRYISDLTLGFSLFVNAQKAETIEGVTDSMVDLIEDTLLSDGSFVSLLSQDGVHNIIESFERIERSYSFPQNGEMYLMECRLLITVRYRCFFTTDTPNAFTEVDVVNASFPGTSTSIPLPQ